MKTILIALTIGLMGGISFAQTTQVKIGRHGACDSGRGICGIQYQPTAKSSTNNAVIVNNSDGTIVLRLYKNALNESQIEMLFGKVLLENSTAETLQIDSTFFLDIETKAAIHQATGSYLNKIDKGSLEAFINDAFIDIILYKSKS
jgi:hypothetical protein